MKIKIEYKFDDGYFASTEILGNPIFGFSEKSFEKAKERLIEKIKDKTIPPIIIPEPEEVEIGE